MILAKELATLNVLSGGRVELGLGVGWLKEEFEALGVPWEKRGARNDEYIAAMRELWKALHAEFHGEFVDFEPCTCSPRPVNGNIPIITGGDSDAHMQGPKAGLEQMEELGVGRTMVPAFFFVGPDGVEDAGFCGANRQLVSTCAEPDWLCTDLRVDKLHNQGPLVCKLAS